MYSKKKIGDTRILIVDDLSPEDIAMVQALYARSSESAEVHIQKIYEARKEAVRRSLPHLGRLPDEHGVDRVVEAVIGDGASARAGKFMSSYYVGYGHRSIGDCGSTTMFIEGVSTLVAKAIQDWPLYSGQETSTRAIDFSGGDTDRVVGRVVDPAGTTASKSILERWMDFYAKSQNRVIEEIRRRYPRQAEEDEATYERAVKARAFDVLRGFLPAGVTTQLSWHSNIRQAGDHLVGLVRHPLIDARTVGMTLAEALGDRYPSSSASFGELASLSGVGGKAEQFGDKEKRWLWEAMLAHNYSYSAEWEPEPCYSTIDREGLERYKQLLLSRPRGDVLPHFLSDLGQLRFNFELDFGSFRDIQRHRNGVCRMPLLTTEFGFEPWYVEQLDERSAEEAKALIHHQTRAISDLNVDPANRQNYVALGYKVPCNIMYTLPAAVYVMELRSSKTVHPTLRRVIHNMIKSFRNLYPSLPLHVDDDPDSWTIRRGAQTITRKEE